MSEFWRDSVMDTMIKDIIDIFHLDGVELVRLSGISKRASNISGRDITFEAMDNIIHKLKDGGVINYKYVTKCPHCGEISYCLVDNKTNSKMCDTCKTFYILSDGTIFERS